MKKSLKKGVVPLPHRTSVPAVGGHWYGERQAGVEARRGGHRRPLGTRIGSALAGPASRRDASAGCYRFG